MYVYIYIYAKPSAWAGCDTTLIFKWNLTYFDVDCSFSNIGCHTMAKKTSLPYYLLIAGGRIMVCTPFPRVLALFKNSNSLVQDLKSVYPVHFKDSNNYTTNTTWYIYISRFDLIIKIHFAYEDPFKFPDKCFGFRLKLVDEFPEIARGAFGFTFVLLLRLLQDVLLCSLIILTL